MQPIVADQVCHSLESCKNGRTDGDAVGVVGSGGPKEPCIRRGSRSPPHRKSSFERGKGQPIVKFRYALPWALQKWLNQLRCHLEFGLGWAQEIRWGCTLAPPIEYQWTVRVRQQCGLVSIYC